MKGKSKVNRKVILFILKKLLLSTDRIICEREVYCDLMFEAIVSSLNDYERQISMFLEKKLIGHRTGIETVHITTRLPKYVICQILHGFQKDK